MKDHISRHNTKLAVYLCLAALLLSVVSITPSPQRAHAQANGRYYPETGKTLALEFLSFYDSNGGLPVFGYPLTDPEVEGGYKVQYLERARIEYHPEHRGTPYEVQLGLLGTILTAGRFFPPAPQERVATTSGNLYFPETNHTLSGAFLTYWQRNGGLALFGYPISEPFEEGGVLAQYFQRNRFELHPEFAGTQYEVQLGLLGRELLAQRVQVREATIAIPTYGYEQGFYTPAGDAIAPYPRLDITKVGPAMPRTYRLIIMENRYLKLSVLPGLGGRLYEAIYKPTGHNELYRNPVIKPSSFGARGWWLAAGGTEWAAPTDEHGLMEYLPWDAAVARNTDGGASITVSAIDKLTGMRVAGVITLSPEDAAYTLSARIENRTSQPQRAQFWTNAMLAPGGTNHVSPRTRFIVPNAEMVVHSTSDPTLPSEHGVISWPMHQGRDISDMSNWHGWLGSFALPNPARGTFAAVYNPDADEGMVKTFKGSEMPGLKIFGFGPSGFDPHIYTDDTSSYVELWGGITPTFWDYATFPPGSTLGWTERWQPVAGLGGVGLANGWGSISLTGGNLNILSTQRIEGATLITRNQGHETARQTFNAYPGKPVSLLAPATVGEVEAEVQSADGRTLLKGVPTR
ncbi:MAG TPA: DUF5107 domain-containing protein [Chloroflexia bacterium]|nr:DUF5107 domain-containing protein [Chloroflexia bacterium]